MDILKINSIESLSTQDGEGVRFVIFLQGCHLQCVYCHNVETWDAKKGMDKGIDELVEQVLRYKMYFGDDGGVTIGGGEPLLQVKPLIKFVEKLKGHGISVVLDTSGAILNDSVVELIGLVDKVLLDIKFTSDEDYKKYVGGDFKKVLAFFDECEKQGKRIWVRIVVVPGLNDSEQAMEKYIEVLKGRSIERVELLPFHTLGFDKYEGLGIKNPLEGTPAMDLDLLGMLQSYIDSKR